MHHEDLKYKINYYVFLALVFLMPFEKKLIPPMIVLFAITSIVNNRFKRIFDFKIMLFASLFGIYLIGMMYTSNTSRGWTNIEGLLPLIVFPLSFLSSKINFKEKILPILTTFVVGSLLSGIISQGFALSLFLDTHDTRSFFLTNASIFLHASYFAMYLNFTIIILYSFIFSKKPSLLSPKISAGLILLSSIMIALTVSKMGIINMIIIHVTAVLYWILVRRKYFKGTLILLSLPLILFAAYSSSYAIRERVDEFVKVSKTGDTKHQYSTSARIELWKISKDLIKAQPIIGYGTGDAKDQLLRVYKGKGFKKFYKKKYNPHNQFLQTTIATGIMGGLTLVLTLLVPLYFSFKNKYYLYSFFILLIIFSIFTESMFERQIGIVFYSLFNSLLYTVYFESKKNTAIP